MVSGRGGTATCLRVAGISAPVTAAATTIAVTRVGGGGEWWARLGSGGAFMVKTCYRG